MVVGDDVSSKNFILISFQDYIPSLKYIPLWFPGASFKRQALEWRIAVDQMADLPFELIKKKIVCILYFESTVFELDVF